MQALESLNEQQVREIYNFIFHPVMMSAQSPDSSVNRNLSHSVIVSLLLQHSNASDCWFLLTTMGMNFCNELNFVTFRLIAFGVKTTL